MHKSFRLEVTVIHQLDDPIISFTLGLLSVSQQLGAGTGVRMMTVRAELKISLQSIIKSG